MSFDIRETRLRNDHQRIRELDSRSDLIHILIAEGQPPEKYVIRFTCRGVEKLAPGARPVYREVHEVSIYLHAEYPLKQPQLKWLTPIFHPNIHGTGAVCIGAWWPAKTLDELILTLGEMIQYKNLGPKDPMNSKAAAWAIRNRKHFPVDSRPLKGQSIGDKILIMADEDTDNIEINIL